MSKQTGFFPPEQLESRDPRADEVLVREAAARRREREKRKQLKQQMVTRQSFFGPVTKSAYEWKKFDAKQTTIQAKSLAPKETKKPKKKFPKPRQGFFKMYLTKRGWVTSPEFHPKYMTDEKAAARKMVNDALNEGAP